MSYLIGLLNVLLILCSLFLICLVLIQRGKGGGLAGAFGGVGGSSAFGTKAGDVFTRVTIIVATVWIVLSMLLVILHNQTRRGQFDDEPAAGTSKTVPLGGTKGKVGKGDTFPVPAPKGDRDETPIPPPPASGARPAPATGPLSPPTSALPEALPEDAPKKKTP